MSGTRRDRDLRKQRLRLWLRLLGVTGTVERDVRKRLRGRFAVTLPRFDLLAALDRAPEGLTMGELSRRLMVSNGSVTGVVERLEGEGLVRRWSPSHDRRSFCVAMTGAGRETFRDMAEVHERWVDEMFQDLSKDDMEALAGLLSKVRQSVEGVTEQEPDRVRLTQSDT